MSNNLIEFPKEQSIRKRLQDKAQDQKAVVSLSIASVLIVSLFLNQWLISGNNSNELDAKGGRQIASFNGDMVQDIKWERDLAKQLTQKDLLENSKMAEKPTLRDELVFGYLQGKYGMKLSQGKIEALEFLSSMAGENPLEIQSKTDFLMSYRDAFGIDFHNVSFSEKHDNIEVYSLVGKDKSIMARAAFNLDESGRLVSLKIEQ